MIGEHTVKVSRRDVAYELTLRRNITIIQGDSGTGKTTLMNMIETRGKKGKGSGIEVECDKKM